MEGTYGEKYSFIGEWYDSQASVTRRYNVFYFPSDDTVEMFDLKIRKIFVRRVKVNGISLDKFCIGGTLLIFGRLIKIIDFACEDTRRRLQKDMEVLVPLSPKSSSDDGIHEELRELLKNSRETYSDFSIFGNKPSICIQKVAFGEMELVQKTTDGHPKTDGGKIWQTTELKTFALIKPIPTDTAGNIITYLNERGLRIAKMKKARLTADDIHFLFRKMLTDPTYAFLMEYLSGQLVIGMELIGKNAVTACNEYLGDGDPLKAAPGTIRALYGTDPVRNCMHSAKTPEDALEDVAYFFPPGPGGPRLRLTATLANCTLCVVKPHAVRAGRLGAALRGIHEGGFDVTALNMLIVEVVNAAEFLEVYKGIVPEYKGMVEELASGACVAMELQARDKSLNTAVEFRKLVGPSDPEIARLLRPHTLRAKLGNTKVQNAIHCSDLPEDGLLEVEYFFKILDF